MPKIKPKLNEEQKFSKNRHDAVDDLAKAAGFDTDAFTHTEFCLMSFFETIIDQCAKIADEQASNYDGNKNESVGCHDAANAIRAYGKIIGNHKKQKGVIGPGQKV